MNILQTHDWDVIKQISNKIQASKYVPTLTHISWHQFDKTEYEELSISNQMNVDVDKIDENCRKEYPDHHPKVQHVDCNTSQLPINGTTVNGSYMFTI